MRPQPPESARAPMGMLFDVPLAPRTTLGVGGPAARYVEARTEEAVHDTLAWARNHRLDVTVLGGGSNVLVADRGVDGLVLRVAVSGYNHAIEGDRVTLSAGAGESWDALVAMTVEQGWAGLECLSGIPGDVGAAPIQNIGAYGQEAGDVITFVYGIDRRSGATVGIDRLGCRFGYRDSVFKRRASGRFVIVGVTFSLQRGGSAAVRYAELDRYLRETGAGPSPSLAEVRKAVLELRRRKSMLVEAGDENARSAGSFFVNPTLDEAAFAEARARIEAANVLEPGETLPQFVAGPGRVKIPAAWLIERAGFKKGTTDGPVGLSTRHALAIVNRGGATAEDILRFARRIRDGVLARFGVRLVPEPVMLGFRPEEVEDLVGHPTT
ncbi:UDP-N-acetylmuramate dehydrogenase [Polyangium sp. 15x6]|uniref:UDP-N-acetylmuramate dehydrogenase n=1 Tax=Polyangium sp. 15x6 TaxID=3042687 RepID=UPI00249A1FF6|nr:UDP-N-acetylmuramate dehydrogenase [Polyangium sp. 15x6]MDI3289392.1 UDP-N-acetylmuramate dehydrogenase [Polyangium sp. 15x6]